MATLTMVQPWLAAGGGLKVSPTPSASLRLLNFSRVSNRLSLNASSCCSSPARPPLLQSGFAPSSSFFTSSFSGLSLTHNIGGVGGSNSNSNRCRRLVVRAGKAALCLTKRSRSRKSLARTHGFRRRMRTTSGRAIIKRRRAKGRRILCTKSNPSRGKSNPTTRAR
ncbi:hypothetical protein Dimus_032674 [Dionaea muscipula]